MLAYGQLCPYWLLPTLASDNHFGVLLLVETYKMTSELASDICTYVANYPLKKFSIKTHGSESRGQEEAACMRVFWPTQPLQ